MLLSAPLMGVLPLQAAAGTHHAMGRARGIITSVITNLTFFRRRPGLDVDGFRRYWQTTHRDLALQLPGLRQYRQHPAHDSAYEGDQEPAYDGVAETVWDDLETLRRLQRSPELAAILADEANLMDLGTRAEILADTVVMLDGEVAPGAITVFAGETRRPDLTPEAFGAYWRDVHAPIGLDLPGMRRYVQHHAVPALYAKGRQPAFDGVAQVWFDDVASFRSGMASPIGAALAQDGPNFLSGTTFSICTTIVMR
jgi:uncharacterized protein (TIGR02118 family)